MGLFRKLHKHLSYFKRRKKNPGAIDRLISQRVNNYNRRTRPTIDGLIPNLEDLRNFQNYANQLQENNAKLLESFKTTRVLKVARRYGDDAGPGIDLIPIYCAPTHLSYTIDLFKLQPNGEGVFYRNGDWHMFSYGVYEKLDDRRVGAIIDLFADPLLNVPKYFFYDNL